MFIELQSITFSFYYCLNNCLLPAYPCQPIAGLTLYIIIIRFFLSRNYKSTGPMVGVCGAEAIT